MNHEAVAGKQRIKVTPRGHGEYRFKANRDLKKVQMPFVMYNGVKYRCEVNGRCVKSYRSKNGLLTVKNIRKKRYNKVQIKPVDYTYTFIISMMFFTLLVILILLLNLLIHKERILNNFNINSKLILSGKILFWSALCILGLGIGILMFSDVDLYLTKFLLYVFDHPNDPVLTFEESIESAFVVMVIIFALIVLFYTFHIVRKQDLSDENIFFKQVIKFFSKSIISLISVFSISFGFIDKELYGLINTNKLVRRLSGTDLNNVLSLTFILPSIAFVALCILIYIYEDILIKKDKQQELNKKLINIMIKIM